MPVQEVPHLRLEEVHKLQKIPGTTDQYQVTEMHPAQRFVNGSESIWIQDGNLFYDGGQVVQHPPSWVRDELAKLTPEHLKSLGMKPHDASSASMNASDERPTRRISGRKPHRRRMVKPEPAPSPPQEG